MYEAEFRGAASRVEVDSSIVLIPLSKTFQASTPREYKTLVITHSTHCSVDFVILKISQVWHIHHV